MFWDLVANLFSLLLTAFNRSVHPSSNGQPSYPFVFSKDGGGYSLQRSLKNQQKNLELRADQGDHGYDRILSICF